MEVLGGMPSSWQEGTLELGELKQLLHHHPQFSLLCAQPYRGEPF